MVLEEMVSLFLHSRKRGTDGAKKKCSERTITIYRDNLKWFTRWLLEEGGIISYAKVTRTHLMQFVDWADEQVTKHRWSESTKLQAFGSLKTFFKWVEVDDDCREAGYKSLHKYLPAIGKKPRRTDIPATKFLKSFKNTFDTEDKWEYRDYVATCLMMDTGVRLGEVCNLEVSQVMFDAKLIFVNGKTGPRAVPITNDMIRLLKAWLKRRHECTLSTASPYLFVSKRAEKMTVGAFGKSFLKHRKKFDLPRISAHTFRHSFCTTYLKKGGNMHDLKLRTGHKSYETLAGYLQEAEAGSVEQHNKTEKFSLLKDV